MTDQNEIQTLFAIPEDNFQKFEAQVAKLSRRSEKLIGMPIKPVVFGFDFVEMGGVTVKVFNVLFTAEVPKIAGWQFVARLDHSNETGNVVRAVPNAPEIPHKYRLAKPSCDHCGINRYRRDTFVVRHEDTGEFKQIGSSCLADFLGHDPIKIAKMAELLGYAVECARGHENIIGAERRYVDLEDFLAYASQSIRQSGWVSRKMERDTSDTDYPKLSTASAAMSNMFPNVGYRPERPTDEDRQIGSKALEWVRAKCGDENLNDYFHNLCAIAGSEMIEFRNTGLAASMVYVYLREQEKFATKTVELGGNMEGVLALFNKAKESKLRSPAIVLMVDDEKLGATEIRMTVAGETARVPGSINVASLGGYGNNTWYGRIGKDGTFDPNRRVVQPTGLIRTLTRFAADPAGVAAEYGKLTGRCCVCYKPLTDPRSADVGYGSTCASKMGWPWGAGGAPKRRKKAVVADLFSASEG